MKRTLISLMVAGLLAVVGTPAMAQNVSPEEQKAAADATKATATATDTKPATATKTDAATSKAELTAAKEKAASDYKAAKVKCDRLKDDAMRTCMSDAKAAQTDALAMAQTHWKSQQ